MTSKFKNECVEYHAAHKNEQKVTETINKSNSAISIEVLPLIKIEDLNLNCNEDVIKL